MRIIMDVDGVTADFTTYLLQTVGSPLLLRDITTWQVLDYLTPSQLAEAHRVLASADWWRRQPTFPGAAAGIAQLRAAGHELVWATAPYPTCREWASVRTTWLGENFGVAVSDVVITSRKELVAGDLLVDDKPANVAAWAQANAGYRAAGHVAAYIFDMPYNQGSPFRRWRWDAIPAAVL